MDAIQRVLHLRHIERELSPHPREIHSRATSTFTALELVQKLDRVRIVRLLWGLPAWSWEARGAEAALLQPPAEAQEVEASAPSLAAVAGGGGTDELAGSAGDQ